MNNNDFKWDEETFKDVLMLIASKNEKFWDWIDEFKKSKQQSNLDYEILSFNDRGNILLKEGDLYSKERYHPLYSKEQLIAVGALIHSVRRISDNEVFTIGDKLLGGEIVKSFEINSKDSTALHVLAGGAMFHFMYAQKEKQRTPLFTTEDGKEIFEGDLYWVVNITTESYWTVRKQEAQKETRREYFLKYFSTEEAGNEYVLLTKPCLSAKDVLSLCRADPGFNNNLKELVKQKLNA